MLSQTKSLAPLNAARETRSLTLLSGAFSWALSVLSGSGSGPILTFAQPFLSQMDAAAPGTPRSPFSAIGLSSEATR